MLRRFLILAVLAVLSACAPNGPPVTMQAVNPMYDGFQDGEYFIPAVPKEYLITHNIRTEVDYFGPEAPGTIVVDVYSRRLYYVLDGGRAVRYGIAVGREGLSFKGSGTIQRKAEWPSWQPTRNMVRTRPDLYAPYAAGLPGGLDNPLGARALYLYRGGRDTMFRIHGTIDPASIGRATSAGCIRLFNQDIIDLYNRVDIGTPVHVRTLDESRALEGIWIDDEFGRIVQVPEGMSEQEALAHVAERRSKLELGVNARMTEANNPPPSSPTNG
ncbi:L,D-transpeptidase [Tabrizicola sp. J26]|uniref:L,D-transpeptidase n=1 Tax=Alitabrizicola rongguiensis TaxID=2909234 RepID=UPI001F3FCE03|nr:L,D-transpeptidase [Tabrizicola rongguiensis]MCF1707800.1 L,D-transpeptidase [Tabrizicola rongguiensis]